MKKLFNGLETNYLDGFQYKFTYAWEDETFTMVNDEMKLRIIPTAEGYFDALLGLYVYNYVDHLGNVRISYSDADHDGIIRGRDMRIKECHGENCVDYFKPGEIVSNNTYYPFGMLFDHNNQVNNENAYKYKYNGKELQETGMYDYGARFYMPDIGRWGVLDPLAEKMTRHSPYNYAFNNPLRFIDPDGRQGTDVIITGKAASVALIELQKSVSSELALKMDKNGKVTYTQNNPKAKLSSDAQQLVNTIDDHSVNVNVIAENSNLTKAGNFYVGGTFSGNKTNYILDNTGNTLNALTQTYQEVNPFVLGAMSTYYGKPGADILHEITESYQGGIIARKLGKDAVFASEAENSDPFSVYNAAHNAATPQTAVDGYQVNYYDKNGKPVNVLYSTGSAEFIINDPKGVKAPLIIQKYP